MVHQYTHSLQLMMIVIPRTESCSFTLLVSFICTNIADPNINHMCLTTGGDSASYFEVDLQTGTLSLAQSVVSRPIKCHANLLTISHLRIGRHR